MSRASARLAIVALALTLMAPMPVGAQIGGLVKKAKKAIQQQENPESGSQLTEAQVGAVLKGLEAALPLLQKRDELAEQQGAAIAARNKALDDHPGGADAYSDSYSKNAVCRDSVFSELDDHMEERVNAANARLVADPQKAAAMAQEAMAMQQKAMQMMQAGDTAGAMRLQKEFGEKRLGIDPKADTAKADAACGAPPVKPAWLVQADANGEKADTLQGRMRELEQKADSESVRAAELSPLDFTAVRERIARWWNQQQGDDPSDGFAEGEVKILKAHQAEIAKLESIL